MDDFSIKPEQLDDRRFDIHVHLLNIFFALREIADYLKETVGKSGRETLLFKSKRSLHFFDDIKDKLKAIKEYLLKIEEIERIATSSYQDLYKEVITTYRKSSFNDGNTANIILAPLMMDIFNPSATGSEKTVLDEIKAHCNNLGEMINKKAGFIDSFFLKNQVREIIKQVETKSASLDLQVKKITESGFDKHLDELVKLRKKAKDTVFPFLAVNPGYEKLHGIRIERLVSDIRERKTFQFKRPFHGIKIYPRLGYKPGDESISSVFDYCADNEVPVTTHTSLGGYPPLVDKYEEYGNPDYWTDVLEKYKGIDETKYKKRQNLYINFAHFGGIGTKTDKKIKWSQKIIDLISCGKYPNLYTDLSCFVEKGRFQAAYEAIMANPAIATRVLYGSDFDMLPLFYNDYISSYRDYVNEFTKVFKDKKIPVDGTDKDLFKLLTVDNPMNFMFRR